MADHDDGLSPSIRERERELFRLHEEVERQAQEAVARAEGRLGAGGHSPRRRPESPISTESSSKIPIPKPRSFTRRTPRSDASSTSSGGSSSRRPKADAGEVKQRLKHLDEMDRMGAGLSGEALTRFLKKQIGLVKEELERSTALRVQIEKELANANNRLVSSATERKKLTKMLATAEDNLAKQKKET